MDGNQRPDQVKDDVVVSLAYTLMVEGEVVDTSEKDEPIQFIQGQGQLIPGLERQLYGMEVGDSKDIMINPSDGYGDEDPSAYADVPRSEFPPQIPLEAGVDLILRNEDGEELPARIEEVTDDSIRLNFNHPLAGKTLYFEVEVIDLRQATTDELEHGHVHDGDEEGEE